MKFHNTTVMVNNPSGFVAAFSSQTSYKNVAWYRQGSHTDVSALEQSHP